MQVSIITAHVRRQAWRTAINIARYRSPGVEIPTRPFILPPPAKGAELMNFCRANPIVPEIAVRYKRVANKGNCAILYT